MTHPATNGSGTTTPASLLSRSTETRLQNQIARAFRRTYGAETGLRTLVWLATSQMRAAGASRSEMRLALKRCMVNRPPHQAGHPALVTSETQTAALTTLMLAWTDEACASDGKLSRP
jgi:hypothetical protein